VNCLIFREQAEIEIAEVARWYGGRAEDLDVRFLQAVDVALAAIQRNPLQYQKVSGELRRVGLHRFPYGLIYVIRGDNIVVVACVHGARDRQHWKDRV
jgi:toxin ParE1/3/4